MDDDGKSCGSPVVHVRLHDANVAAVACELKAGGVAQASVDHFLHRDRHAPELYSNPNPEPMSSSGSARVGSVRIRVPFSTGANIRRTPVR